MNRVEETTLALLGQALFSAPCAVPSDTDWAALQKEALEHMVAPLVFDALKTAEVSLPSDIQAQWWEYTVQTVYYNEQLLYEQQQIVNTLEQQNIPCAVLKGSSVSCNYPNPQLRVLGDIDLLVSPDNQYRAAELLQKQGYTAIRDEKHHCHFTISKNGMVVEIHKEPNGLFLEREGKIAQAMRAEFSTALDCRIERNDVPVLCDTQQAIVLILHKLEHFLSGELGLRQLADWAMFVHTRLNETVWESLKPLLSRFGLYYFTEIITGVCIEYLSLPPADVPWAREYDRALAREVIEAVVQSGNFGRKIKQNTYGNRYFYDVHANNRLSSAWKSLWSLCHQRWPICNRHPILLPIAPIVLFSQYRKLRKTGQRPAFHPLKMYRYSGAKQQLYRSLKPFLTDIDETR